MNLFNHFTDFKIKKNHILNLLTKNFNRDKKLNYNGIRTGGHKGGYKIKNYIRFLGILITLFVFMSASFAEDSNIPPMETDTGSDSDDDAADLSIINEEEPIEDSGNVPENYDDTYTDDTYTDDTYTDDTTTEDTTTEDTTTEDTTTEDTTTEDTTTEDTTTEDTTTEEINTDYLNKFFAYAKSGEVSDKDECVLSCTDDSCCISQENCAEETECVDQENQILYMAAGGSEEDPQVTEGSDGSNEENQIFYMAAGGSEEDPQVTEGSDGSDDNYNNQEDDNPTEEEQSEILATSSDVMYKGESASTEKTISKTDSADTKNTSTVNGSSVPMQKTGIPLTGIVLGIFAVISGLASIKME
jgi:hypothetical protein